MTLPKTPSFRLDGRRALVTGASRGIGLACACALGEAGARLVLAARDAAALDGAVAEMGAAGMEAEAMVLDVNDVEATRAALDGAGAFDVVVNSAGIARNVPAFDVDPADFQAVVDTNVRGAFFVATCAARRMAKEGRPGSIVQVSSQMGHVGGIDRTVYCGSKHAVEGMTKAMAVEWASLGIRVNTICPTFVRTALTEKTFADPERVRWIEEKIKLGRVAEVEDLMGAVLFLASDASAMVTGAALLVDGGWTAG